MKRLFAVVGLVALVFAGRAEAAVDETLSSATLTIDGVSTSDMTFTSLTRGSNGSIVATLDGLKRPLSRKQFGRVFMLRLTPAPGAPPEVMVGILKPSDAGTSLTVRAYQVGHGLCDPSSLKDSLTTLNGQKSALETSLLALESSISGAEIADTIVCTAAFKNAVDSLTLEMTAAAFLGDFALEAELAGRLYALKQSPPVCDPAGVAALTSTLDAAESELALVDLAIKGVLEELRACVAGK